MIAPASQIYGAAAANSGAVILGSAITHPITVFHSFTKTIPMTIVVIIRISTHSWIVYSRTLSVVARILVRAPHDRGYPDPTYPIPEVIIYICTTLGGIIDGKIKCLGIGYAK